MNQFEFLRAIPLGQYLPVESPLHRFDPRARMIAYSLLLMGLTFTHKMAGIALGLAIILLLLRLGRIPYRFALRGLLPPLPFLLILALLQVLLNHPLANEKVLLALGPIAIAPSGLIVGVMLLLRFMALILIIGVATGTLSTGEMTGGLNALFRPLAGLGIPAQDLVMVVQVTLRFLPLLAQTTERIAKAQASRGANWDSRKGNLLARMRQVIPVIIPMFLASLRRAEAMALAMDARAYGSSPQRTSLVELHFGLWDAFLIAGALLAGAGILYL